MDEQSIRCPNCKTQIPFTEAIKEIKNKIKEESDLEFKSKENDIKNNIRIEYESKIKEAVEKTSKEKDIKLNDALYQKNKIEEETKQKIQNFQTIINKNDVEFKLKEKTLKDELQKQHKDNEENNELFKSELKKEFDIKSQNLQEGIKESNIKLQNLQENLKEKDIEINNEKEKAFNKGKEETSKEKDIEIKNLSYQKNELEKETKQKIQTFQTIINKNAVEFKLKEENLKNKLQKQYQENEENKNKFEIDISKKYDENIESFKYEIKKEFDTKSQTLQDTLKQSNINLQNLQETLKKKDIEINNTKEESFNKGKEEALIEKDLELKEKDTELKNTINQKNILEKNIKEKDTEINEVRKEAFNKGRDDTLKTESDNYRFKMLEKDKQLDNMKKIIDELKLKSEQGSQQIQGEIFEENLEKILITKFPQDHILPVPKGIKGADILHKIYNEKGLYCGTIIWEVKNTKTWNNEWINKLKDDQLEIRADISVLMTKTLPKNINNFEYTNGIFITDYKSVIGLSTTLRNSIIQIEITKQSLEGKDDKKEVLYKYLSSQEFRQKVESIVETFSMMKNDLDTEKRVITKTWSKREKQIERIANNTTKIYGDIQGLIGTSLQQIKNLELEALTDGNDNNDNIININKVNPKIRRLIKDNTEI